MNDSLSLNPHENPVPPMRSTSLGARMVNVLATPGDVFDEVKTSPPQTANWLVPALLALLIGWIGSWLIMNQEAIRQQISDLQESQYQKLVDKGRMTREQLETQRPMMEKMANISQQVGAAVGPPILVFGSLFWWALITFLVGKYALGGTFSFMKAVEVSGLAGVVGILESAVKTLLMMAFGSLFAGPNLATLLVREFDPANLTHGLLGAVDLMAFWVLAVRAIGLARLSGASLGKAVVWVFGFWFFWTGSWIVVGHFLQRLFGGG